MRLLSIALAAALSFCCHRAMCEEAGFPLVTTGHTASVHTDREDFKVVHIAAGMLADDVERVTGKRPELSMTDSHRTLPRSAAVIAGTLGHSRLVDWIVGRNQHRH